jgi:hypothetical protein
MAKLIIEIRKDGTTNAFCAGTLLKRIPEGGDYDYQRYRWKFVVWDRDTWDDRSFHLEETPPKLHGLLEKAYKSGRYSRKTRRFPRLPRRDRMYAMSDIPSVQEIEDHSNQWLVDGLIPAGLLVLMTAPPAGYKTWLALHLAGCVSKGAEFLSHTTLKTPVFYLDRENRVPVIRERLNILKHNDRDFLKVWGRWLSEPPPLIGDKRLIHIARRYRPLIIIDSLVRFHSAEENNATQMAAVLENLLRLVNEGATVVVLHHQGKASGTKYRGSTDILAAVDVAFAIDKNTQKDRIVLTLDCYKHRQVEEFDLTLRPDLENGRFEVIDDPRLRSYPPRLKASRTPSPGTRDSLKKSC